MSAEDKIAAIVRRFQIPGEFREATPYGSGHIHDTWSVLFDDKAGPTRTILQRINGHIFTNPVALMENIGRVTAHLAGKVAGQADSDRRVLRLIPARDGLEWHVDEAGSYWRSWHFIENARSYDAVQSTAQAFEASKAFGHFQKMLVDLPQPRLHDILPDFHNTPKRFASFERAVELDRVNRAFEARPEIEFAFAHKPIAGVLIDANLPQRVTHNDTKINNVLIDDETGEGICVIDLDTVMPGLSLYDFGDMVRTTTCTASEDERDLSKVNMQMELFEALVRGYLDSAGDFLTSEEKRLLAFSALLITFEQGVRFLTDYLAGDTYYKVNTESQNLDRCRAQFKLVESIEQQQDAMDRLVKSIC